MVSRFVLNSDDCLLNFKLFMLKRFLGAEREPASIRLTRQYAVDVRTKIKDGCDLAERIQCAKKKLDNIRDSSMRLQVFSFSSFIPLWIICLWKYQLEQYLILAAN